MTRPERITVALAVAAVAAFAAVMVAGAATYLNSIGWFGGGANIIQWTSGPATFLAVVTAAAMHLNRTCAARWYCVRRGEHPVAGTLEKVCRQHHTLTEHEAVHAKHAAKHAASGRLGFGESHQHVQEAL